MEDEQCDYEISATFPDENAPGMESPKFTGQLNYKLYYQLGGYTAEVCDVAVEGFPVGIKHMSNCAPIRYSRRNFQDFCEKRRLKGKYLMWVGHQLFVGQKMARV